MQNFVIQFHNSYRAFRRNSGNRSLRVLFFFFMILPSFIFQTACKEGELQSRSQTTDYTEAAIFEEDSNLIFTGNSEAPYFSFVLGCKPYTIDFQFSREIDANGNATRWDSAKALAESESDFDCSDLQAEIILSSNLFIEDFAKQQVLFRQVFPYGYSEETLVSILNVSQTPNLSISIDDLFNLDFVESVDYTYSCNFLGSKMTAALIRYDESLGLMDRESVVTSTIDSSNLTCEEGTQNGSFSVTGLGVGVYQLVLFYDDLEGDEDPVAFENFTLISASPTGLTWVSGGFDVELFEGASFSSLNSAAQVKASHPDPTAEITFSVGESTCSAWDELPAVDQNGLVSATVATYSDGGANIYDDVCTLTLVASSRTERIETVFNVRVLNSFCSSGNLETSCVFSESVALPSNRILSGNGNVTVNEGVIVSVTANEQTAFSIEGTMLVQGRLRGNFDITAGSLVVTAAGAIDGEAMGEPAQVGEFGSGDGCSTCSEGDGAGHAGKGGAGRSVFTGDFGGSSYGALALADTFGSAGAAFQADGQGGSGGGKISIRVGSLELDGVISVAGGEAVKGGGGAGGSLIVAAENVSGSGTFDVSGGNASLASGNDGFGGGSGGYLNLETVTTSFDGDILIDGGKGSVGASLFTLGGGGEKAQVRYAVEDPCDEISSDGTCRITTHTYLSGGSYAYSSLTVAAGAVLKNPSSLSEVLIFDLDRDFTSEAGSFMYSNLRVTSVGSITVSGTIDATGFGYAAGNGSQDGQGPGAGAYDFDSEAGGGGHFTSGGDSGGASGVEGSSYGTAGTVSLGSGGAGGNFSDYSYSVSGGRGGGSVELSAPSVILSGSLISNGENAGETESLELTEIAAGGGAGGYIKITTSSGFSGGGALSASGGSGGKNNGLNTNGSGGGGKGHIEIVGPDFFSGVTSVEQGQNGY